VANPIDRYRNMSKRQRMSLVIGVLFVLSIIFVVSVLFFMIRTQPYSLYTNEEYGVSIKYPSDWEVVENPGGVPGSVVVFLAPQQTAMDVFRVNINITAKPLPPSVQNINYFSKMAEKQLTGTFEGYVEVLASGSQRFGGAPGHRFMYVAKGVDKNIKDFEYLQYLHVWGLHGDQAYILTYVAKKPEFKDFLGIFNTMTRSFKYIR